MSDFEQTGAGASGINAGMAENVMRQYAREAMDGLETCAPEDYAALVDMICAWAYASMIEDRKIGAGEGDRTLDILVGNEMLYR